MADWPTGPPTASADPGRPLGGAAYPTRPPEQWPTHGPAAPLWSTPAGPPLPPEGGRDGSPDRSWPVVVIAVAAVCLLAVLIVGAGALLTSSDDGSDEASDTTIDLDDPSITAPPSEEPIEPQLPSMPSMPSIPGFDPGEQAVPLADVLPELIDFVEVARGHRFATEPVVEAVADAEFEDRLATAREAEDPALAPSPATLEAQGLVPPGFDLDRAADTLDEIGVLGFYDPATAELVVKGDAVTPFVQYVIVHELTHALDDQLVDLSTGDELVGRGDETWFGFQALVEGTASHVAAQFEAQLSEEDAAAFEAEQAVMLFEQLPAGMGLPPYLLLASQIPYSTGQRLVDDLVAEGGKPAIDAAYAAPPTTSEQVLDPDAYRAAEPAVALTPPEAPDGAEVEDEGVFGAVDLRMLDLVANPLGALLDPEAGLLAPVPGYGGGRFVTWSDAGGTCISIEAVGDDAAGSATIQESLEAWAEVTDGAEVGSRVGGRGVDVITATRCA